jgi:hypothetical protein
MEYVAVSVAELARVSKGIKQRLEFWRIPLPADWILAAGNLPRPMQPHCKAAGCRFYESLISSH